jgi:copper chaperone CopZ
MLQSMRMKVPAMNTARETREVSDALTRVQGVADVGVKPDDRLVEVKYDPTKTDTHSIHDAVRKAGYALRPR